MLDLLPLPSNADMVVMPRGTPKISLATAPGPKPKASIKTADWKRIEKAYGKKLPKPARRAVLKASDRYLSLAMFEPAAEPVRDTAKRLQEIGRCAPKLMDALSKCGVAFAAAVQATRLIERHLKDPWLPKGDKTHSMLLLLGQLTGACASGLRDLKRESAKNYYRPGGHWDAWVVGLA